VKAFDDYRTFEAKVSVNRIADKGYFVADIAIRCVETGEVMEFDAHNLRCGISSCEAMLNWGDTELRIPIRPPIREKPGDWDNKEEWERLCADPGQGASK